MVAVAVYATAGVIFTNAFVDKLVGKPGAVGNAGKTADIDEPDVDYEEFDDQDNGRLAELTSTLHHPTMTDSPRVGSGSGPTNRTIDLGMFYRKEWSDSEPANGNLLV